MASNAFSDVIKLIRHKNGKELGQSLHLYNMPRIQALKTIGRDAFEEQARASPQVPWRPVLAAYAQAIVALVEEEDLPQSFKHFNDMTIALNNLAITQDVWIVPALKSVNDELRRLACINPECRKELLEIVARTLNGTLRICLNDREEVRSKSKQSAVYHFATAILGIYFYLGAYSLANGTVRVVAGIQHVLPPFEKFPAFEKARYLCYSGMLKVIDGSYAEAEQLLSQALATTPKSAQSLSGTIMLYLLPIKLLNSKCMPKPEVWALYPNLEPLRPLIDACKDGDWDLYQKKLLDDRDFLVKYNLFLVFAALSQQCLLRAIVRSYKILSRPTRISFKQFQSVFEAIGYYRRYNITVESQQYASVEQILAGYITKGEFKGYIAHGAETVVLSGKQPFPHLLKKIE